MENKVSAWEEQKEGDKGGKRWGRGTNGGRVNFLEDIGIVYKDIDKYNRKYTKQNM